MTMLDKSKFNAVKQGPYTFWCIPEPETLPLEEQDELVLRLGTVASRGFGHNVSAARARAHIIAGQKDLIVVTHQSPEEMIAFAGVEDIEYYPNGLFLTSIAILPEYQGTGLGTLLFSYIQRTYAYSMLAYTTQSPIMYLLMRKFHSIVYPNHENEEEIPEEVQALGKQIVLARNEHFDPETFVLRDYYEVSLYPNNFPWINDTKVNDYFQNRLSIANHQSLDGFLFLGFRELPRRAKMQESLKNEVTERIMTAPLVGLIERLHTSARFSGQNIESLVFQFRRFIAEMFTQDIVRRTFPQDMQDVWEIFAQSYDEYMEFCNYVFAPYANVANKLETLPEPKTLAESLHNIVALYG